MNVEDGDELVGAAFSDGSSEIVLVSKLAQAIRFVEADVRPMGLPAAGVWGVKLSSGDEVVALAMARPNADLVLVTSAGFFKRTPMSEFPVQGRHGGGVAATRLGQKSGAIADAVVAEASDEFFSASRKGTLRKIDYTEIPGGKRSAQGKLLIQPAQGDTISALLHLPTARGRRGGGSRRSGPTAPAPDRPADSAPEPEETAQLTFGGWVEPEPAVKPTPKPKRITPPAPAAKSQPMARGFKLDEVTTTPAKPASRATKPAVPKSAAAAKPAAKSSAPAASKPAGASKAAAKPAASKGGATPKPAAKPAPAAKSSAAKRATTAGTRGRK
jgi:hypothetical protein